MLGILKILEKNLPDAKFIYTSVNEKPYFADNKVDMIYMGSMPDEYVEIIVKALVKYKTRLKELIEDKVVMLFTEQLLSFVVNIFLRTIINKKHLI